MSAILNPPRCSCLLALLFAAKAAWTQPPTSSAAGGLSMEAAVAEGLRNNLDLIAARYNIPIAEADELAAGLWYNPALTLDTTLQPFHLDRSWDQGHTGGPAEYDLSLAYPLDMTGKRGKRKASARAATEAAGASFEDAVRLKILDIRRSYIETLEAAQMLAFAKEKQGNLERLVQLIQRRIGRKDLLPLLQTRATLAYNQAALAVRQRESALRVSKAALAQQLGRSIGSPIEPSGRLRDFKIAPLPERAAFIRDAVARRPDLRVLRLARSKASLDLSLNRAMALDNALLGLGISRQNGLSVDPQTPGIGHNLAGGNSWTANLAIPLPLFNRNQGGIQRSELQIAQLDAQIASLELAIRQEIVASYDQVSVNMELISQYESEDLRNAQAVRDAQQRLFGTGANALLDYFDAMGAYNEALASYTQAVSDYRKGIAQLNAAAGKDVLP